MTEKKQEYPRWEDVISLFIPHSLKHGVCSNCWRLSPVSEYCPRCGAKMANAKEYLIKEIPKNESCSIDRKTD